MRRQLPFVRPCVAVAIANGETATDSSSSSSAGRGPVVRHLSRHGPVLTREALHRKHDGCDAAKRRLLLRDLQLLALCAAEAVLHHSILLRFLSTLAGVVVAGGRHGGRVGDGVGG